MHSQSIDSNSHKHLALIGLILVGIAPTVSVLTGFAFKAGVLAIVVFVFTKLWIFGLPAFWHLRIDKNAISRSPALNGGWAVSAGLGIVMAVVIMLAYFIIGDTLLSNEDLIEILDPFGLTTPWKLMLAILFWVFINSVLEEFVFRWFITSKIEQLVSGKWLPILLSAGVFTLHHTIALAFFIDPLGNFLASMGVFVGGVIFSWIYIEYRSIWVAWVAHAIADVAVFAIAWQMIVGF